MAEVKKLKNDELEKVSGGNDGTNYSYDWTYGQVHDVVDYGAGSCLPLRNYPNGDVLKTNDGNIIGWKNNDTIIVQPSSREGDWIKAKYGATIGWANANYISY